MTNSGTQRRDPVKNKLYFQKLATYKRKQCTLKNTCQKVGLKQGPASHCADSSFILQDNGLALGVANQLGVCVSLLCASHVAFAGKAQHVQFPFLCY